jgi:hypothetical protein
MSSIKLTADSGGGTFEIKAPSSGSNARVLTIPDSASGTVLTTTNPKAGNIIQVVETKITARSSVNMTTTYTDVPGFAVTITPTSASNKIKLTAMINQSSRQQHGGGRFVRSVGGVNAVPTGWIGDSADSRTRSTTGNLYGNVYIDGNGTDSNFAIPCCLIDDSHNTTSAITYKFQISNVSGSYPIKFNTADDDDIAATHVAVSSMIVEEIAA